MAKLGLSIVMLGVTDVERSAAFYVEKVGLRATGQIPGFVFLDGGGVSLALSQPLTGASEHLVGALELVFGVDNVRGAYAELRRNGVEFITEPRVIDGTNWAANFLDPDGHVLSIFGPEGSA